MNEVHKQERKQILAQLARVMEQQKRLVRSNSSQGHYDAADGSIRLFMELLRHWYPMNKRRLP